MRAILHDDEVAHTYSTYGRFSSVNISGTPNNLLLNENTPINIRCRETAKTEQCDATREEISRNCRRIFREFLTLFLQSTIN